MSVVARPAQRIAGTLAPGRSAGRPLWGVLRRGLADKRRAPLSWSLPLGRMCGLIVGMHASIEDCLGEDRPERRGGDTWCASLAPPSVLSVVVSWPVGRR